MRIRHPAIRVIRGCLSRRPPSPLWSRAILESVNKQKRVFGNVLEAIGSTPLVRINRITAGMKGTVYAKIETTNHGN